MFTNNVNSPCLFRQSKLGCSLIFYDVYDSCVSNKQTRNQVEEIGAHVHNTVCSPRRCVARATGRRPRRKWRLRNRASWSRESTFLFASSSRNRFHIAPSQFLLGRCAFRVFVSRFRRVSRWTARARAVRQSLVKSERTRLRMSVIIVHTRRKKHIQTQTPMYPTGVYQYLCSYSIIQVLYSTLQVILLK